jgi:hypothetical protein
MFMQIHKTVFIIIIIIIIIGKTLLIEPWSSLADTGTLYPVFTSLDFVAFFLKNKIISLAFNPQPGGPGPCIYVADEQGGQLYPQAPGSLFVVFYASQGCGGSIITHLHKVNCEVCELAIAF